MSTPRSFAGRSLICPIEAITMKSLPRYLLIVFALAGDSTMTKFFVIAYQVQSRTDECSMTGGCFQTNCLRFSGGGLENSTNRASKAKPPLDSGYFARLISPCGVRPIQVGGACGMPAGQTTSSAQCTFPEGRESVRAFPSAAARWSIV